MASATRSSASIPDHLTKEEVRITTLIVNWVRPALMMPKYDMLIPSIK